MESNVEIFIENEKGKSFLVDCPKEIKYSQLQKIIKDKNITELTNYYYILLNGATYDDNNLNEILKLEEGDKLIIVNERSDENGYFIEFHKNYNLNENDMKTEPLTGLLRLMLVKYISSFISDTSNINSQEIKKIISDLRIGLKEKENTKEDIKANLEETQGNNILVYSNYINSIISDKIINQLLQLLPKNKQNEVKKQWSLLSKYQDFSKLFEEELFKAIERSYFDYSLIGLSLYEQKNRRIFIESMNTCPNLVVKYLFHGTQLDPIKEILTDGFLYTRKAFYGMGIYFSDMLDYVAFYAGGKDFKTRREYFGKVIPVNSVFSCVSAEIYYSQSKKKDIYDFNLLVKTLDHFPTYEEIKRDYPDKMVEEKDGIHFARVEPYQGRVRKREQIIDDAKKGKFIGNEYVITEFQQILPLYGLTFRRNEFFVVWRDNHFKGNNEYSKFLKERKLFIYEYAKMNAYFEDSLEKALEIIKRKKYNKIILISNIGLDKAGKKFVEVARKLLGFNVVVLFFSGNSSHFSWLQNFPNALYTNNSSFYKDFILNYNEKGLLDLKKKIENQYKIKLKFTNDYMKFPNFIDSDKYDNIIFGGPSPNFKKVIISNSYNKVILCMNSDSEPCFKSVDNDVNSYIWYITLMDNEITLYSNGNYLGVNTNSKKATREEFMKTFKFEKIGKNDYIIYFDDKNNVLTVSGSNAIIQKESYNNSNQKFRLVEEIENA